MKLNGGDIKAVQGDSGHAQTSMVAEVYSHIIDDDRRKNAELFEDASTIDPELLAKVLGNPDMVALLTTLAKGMK